MVRWSEENQHGLTEEAYTALRADYTRLFVMPGPFFSPPWESVYCNADRLTFQEQTAAVRSWYRRYGLEPEKLHQEPDDHIALELSFISHLAGLALKACQEQDTSTFQGLLNAQRSFLRDHLLHWAPQWCARVAVKADTLFYRGIALVAKGALKALDEVLGA